MSGRFGMKPGKQSVYKGKYSPDVNEGSLAADKCDLMGEDSRQLGYDPEMGEYNPANTVADHRAGETSENVLQPAPFEFQCDTVDVNDGIPPKTHIRGGFPSEVSRSKNHPGYKRQPR